MEQVVEETYKINSNTDIRVDLERREKFYRDQLTLKEEGRMEGRLEIKKETAIEMWKDGETIQKISKYTKLSEDEIKAIISEEKI